MAAVDMDLVLGWIILISFALISGGTVIGGVIWGMMWLRRARRRRRVSRRPMTEREVAAGLHTRTGNVDAAPSNGYHPDAGLWLRD